MPEAGAGTFARLLLRYVHEGVIRPHESVLVQFAGAYDEQVCNHVGLVNCHFANIAPDTPSTGQTTAARFDAHEMPQPDESFDHVIGHAGLHHCSRPHEALHEMYRLARRTVLFVENQDSALMRVAGRVGVVGSYELPAVIGGGYTSGGVDGTAVPNFVYRWTRREVRKAVAAFDPGRAVPIEFHAEWNLASGRDGSERLARFLRLRSSERAERVLSKAHRALNSACPSQGNIFAALIRKDRAVLQPWMETPDRMARLPDS